MAKAVLFSVLLSYVICNWSDFNAPHTNVTLIFLKFDVLFCLRQLAIWSAVASIPKIPMIFNYLCLVLLRL